MFLIQSRYKLFRICCRNRGCRASKSLCLDTYIVLNRWYERESLDAKLVHTISFSLIGRVFLFSLIHTLVHTFSFYSVVTNWFRVYLFLITLDWLAIIYFDMHLSIEVHIESNNSTTMDCWGKEVNGVSNQTSSDKIYKTVDKGYLL